MFRNFSWIIEDELAGMAKPSSLVSDFEFLKEQGINAIISLTETSLQKSVVNEFGFEYLHLPIPDFSIPTLQQIEKFISFTNKLKEEHKKVVVHCKSGIGRTGTMLAIYFVTRGYSAKDAISEVRSKRPGSIETFEQEKVIFEFAKIV